MAAEESTGDARPQQLEQEPVVPETDEELAGGVLRLPALGPHLAQEHESGVVGPSEGSVTGKHHG